MKKSQTSVIRTLFVSVLSVGLYASAGAVSADTMAAMPGYTGSSDVTLLASTDFKGEHRYTSHTAYERHSEKNHQAKFERKSGVVPVVFKGKPPYNRHLVHRQPLEKVQFARFEEGKGINKASRHSIYRGSQGQRPPYRRN